MICFPNAKINIGLRILEKRADGYHNIESIFYPVGWCDILEAVPVKGFGKIELNLSGIPVPGRTDDDNLCVKLYKLLLRNYKLPSLKVWLHKTIPVGAGLGGGSSDAAHFMKLLNTMCRLNLSIKEMQNYAATLGSDCVFFIENKPVIATQKGEVLEAINLNLCKYAIVLVYPQIPGIDAMRGISTVYAYSLITPVAQHLRGGSLKEQLLNSSPAEWKSRAFNDFEKPIFEKFPAIEAIKDWFYKHGALFASMTGSGSAVYGIFKRGQEAGGSGQPVCRTGREAVRYKTWTGNLTLPI